MTTAGRIEELISLVESNPGDHIYAGMLRVLLCQVVWPVAKQARSYMAFGYNHDENKVSACVSAALMIPNRDPRFSSVPGGGGLTPYSRLPALDVVHMLRMEWCVGNGDGQQLSAIEQMARSTDPYLYCPYEPPTCAEPPVCT